MTKYNIFTGGHDFSASETELKSKFQMVNIAIILSSAGLIFGMSGNIIKGTPQLIPIESILLFTNIILFFILTRKKSLLSFVAMMETLQFSVLFLFLIYISQPEELKHIWLFTYPIILLYFQNEKNATYWVGFMIVMLMIAPLQPFVKIAYSLYQVTYISFVLGIISIIIYFYQKKMDEAKATILKQQEELRLQVNELTKKDKLLGVQSKQAVMGEMLSMIAHQWRQPLSTVTLSISDLQVKRMLGKEIDDAVIDKTLQEISDTVVYLSETIEDFKTYFQPNKEVNALTVAELLQRASNFIRPRLDGAKIDLVVEDFMDFKIQTYANELIQVILNLLNNAIDELEKIAKKDAKIEIKVQEIDHSFILSISDNAGGIPADKLDEIFEPYYSTKGKNGTGLGLYMSKMIMEKQFNSAIKVSSSENGSTFSMKIAKKF